MEERTDQAIQERTPETEGGNEPLPTVAVNRKAAWTQEIDSVNDLFRAVVPESPRRKKYSYTLSAKDDDFILKSIEEHKTLAYMAQKIGCCRQALARYIHQDPVLQQAFTDAKDGMDDLAELRLFEKINNGDLGAIMFYMPRKMRHRGYGDQPIAEQGPEVPRVIIGKIPDTEIREAEVELAEIPELGVDEQGNPIFKKAKGADGAASEETPALPEPEAEAEPAEAETEAAKEEPEEAAEADGGEYDDTDIGDPLFG